jgi:hypothetical protein
MEHMLDCHFWLKRGHNSVGVSLQMPNGFLFILMAEARIEAFQVSLMRQIAQPRR